MNKFDIRIPLFISFLTFALVLMLQSNVSAMLANGKIYYATDTIETVLDIPIFMVSGEPKFRNLQKKVSYIDGSGNRVTLYPDDAAGFEFTFEDVTSIMLSRYNNLKLSGSGGGENIFLRLEVDGRLSVFEYYLKIEGRFIYDFNYSMSYTKLDVVKKYILQKEDRPLVRTYDRSFRPDMTAYFFDCVELSKMIGEKVYISDNIKAVASYYNTECK